MVAVKTWSDKAHWRTWLTHSVLALPIAFLSDPSSTTIYFLLRELEQLSHELMDGVKPNWKDHFFDWYAPAATVGVVWLVWALL